MKTHINIAAKVRYRIEVLEDGKPVRTFPFRKNLILNTGLHELSQRTWDEVIRYAAAGTDATPTKRPSGNVTFTQAGTVVTASAGFFVQEDAGRLLKLDTGEEMAITSYVSGTQVNVSLSRDSAAPDPGTVWYVNQTALIAPVMRTDTYGNGGADNSVTIADGELIRRRTFIFPARTTQVTIREVGWGWYSGLNDPLFGRDVLDGAGVPLAVGQQLKIVLELVIAITPLSPALLPGPFQPGGGGGQIQLENLRYPEMVSPSKYDYNCVLSDADTPFRAADPSEGAGSLGGNRKSVNTSRSAYVNGSYRYEHTATFTLNDGNMEGIRCVSIGWHYYDTFYPVLRVIFDNLQMKDSDHTLTLVWAISWGRILEN
ncbi:MAG: hypothetical protein LBK99_01530 [Opitutaceae bacterium]|jgi:hypothetical protein|nr:hypothetical protein [Opitutaceae bacterium]